jgi:3-(3-hydroxy-phenyl)propionate hydroxylase
MSSDTEVDRDLDADVIVVGMGPVGAMTALRAAQRGLRVIAIDRSSQVYPLPRAIGMDQEIQQLFEAAGLLGSLRANSTPMRAAEFVDHDGRRVVGVDLPPGTVGALGHPFMVAFEQPPLERDLRAAVRAAGVEVRLGYELVSIEDHGGGVRAGVVSAEGTMEHTARWLIGADGAKSTVRQIRGIGRTDLGFDQRWLVVDTTLCDPDLELPAGTRQICSASRVTTFVEGHGNRRRWEFRLHPDETREEVLADPAIEALLAPFGTPAQLRVDRAAVYRFHATVANSFRDGPVFLAGDAAHQMPPFNAQGMCSGMRDAENLAWKLAAVARSAGGDRLLDTYEQERRPHAAAQVAHAVDAGRLIDAIVEEGDAGVASGYGQQPFPRLDGGALLPGHSAVGLPLPAALDDGPRDRCVVGGWTLIADRPIESPMAVWDHLGASVLVRELPQLPGPRSAGQVVIVRPDRYVAAVTDDPADAGERLATLMGAGVDRGAGLGGHR